MKPGVVLVTTRGELADEEALVEAPCAGHVRAAGLGVYTHEPLLSAHPFMSLENVVSSPHVAFRTAETTQVLYDMAIDNIVDCFARRPTNVVAGPTAASRPASTDRQPE